MEEHTDQLELPFWNIKEVEQFLDVMLQDILKDIDEAEKTVDLKAKKD